MTKQVNYIINGCRPRAEADARSVYNPATSQQSGSVDLAGSDEVREAVAAARAAFPKWADTTPLRRVEISTGSSGPSLEGSD